MERDALVMENNNENQFIDASISNPGFVCLFRVDPHITDSVQRNRQAYSD
jgi:hypothetical protein